MTEPVRLQLSRRKGFDLQAVSRATNGLDAARVARGYRCAFGNPFSISFCESFFGLGPAAARTRAIELFRKWITGTLEKGWTSEPPPASLEPLRGKNLACWCKPDDPCHADVLLELANQ